jgi:signal transduction histidine kinase
LYGDLPCIFANPQQLNQVFANILINASQAIEKNGEIRIETQHLEDCIRIRISDNGSGIAEKNLERIFDPFFTTKDTGKGTGLGMHIAFRIVKKHRGDIQVESRVGEGTTFSIQLPLNREQEMDGAVTTH